MTIGRAPVAVIGAGFAGLVAARELRRRGIPIVVYEAGQQVAGLARSFRDEEGFTHDIGAHFITNRLAREIGVTSSCRVVRRYGETAVVNGHTYSYPFGLMRSPRYLAGGIAARLSREGAPVRSAADWFRATYGRPLADEVALPLLEAWSGAPASVLSPDVGLKLSGGIAMTAWLKLASHVTRRAVASGYCREMPESARVWHVYPEGGVSLLCEHLAESVSDAIRLESPVQGIVVEDGRAVGVRVCGRVEEVSAVVSTAPVHVLAKLAEGTIALEPLRRFRYRPMTFVNMRFVGRGILPDVVTWTPESSFPFFRLTEAPLSMPWLAPAGKTMVTADIGCRVGDEIWSMDEEAIGALCVEHLVPIVSDARRRYRGCHVVRTPIAYPVFHNEYEEERKRFAQSSGVEGLYSIGRNGEFAHLLMEDIYWRTLRQVDALTRVSPPAVPPRPVAA